MTVEPDTGTATLPERGVDAPVRGPVTLLAVWLLVGVDAILTACTVGAWFYLRAADIDGGWRGLRCSPVHPCRTTTGNPVTGPVPAAGHGHLIGVILGAVVVAALACQAVRAAGRRAERRPVGRAVRGRGRGHPRTPGRGLQEPAVRQDRRRLRVPSTGMFWPTAWSIWSSPASCSPAWPTGRRLGRVAADGSTFRAVGILAVSSTASVVALCLVASVGA